MLLSVELGYNHSADRASIVPASANNSTIDTEVAEQSSFIAALVLNYLPDLVFIWLSLHGFIECDLVASASIDCLSPAMYLLKCASVPDAEYICFDLNHATRCSIPCFDRFALVRSVLYLVSLDTFSVFNVSALGTLFIISYVTSP